MKVLALLAAVGLFALSETTNASPYVVTLQQNGPDVVATGSGNIDTTGLGLFNSGLSVPFLNASLSAIGTGATGGFSEYAGAVSGPGNFGSGSTKVANSGSGPLAGVFIPFGFIIVPSGYTSDSFLSDSATYSSATFATLGVTPGDYVWTWGRGPDQTFELIIGAVTAVPEPSTWSFVAAGLAGFGLLGWRRKRKLTAAA